MQRKKKRKQSKSEPEKEFVQQKFNNAGGDLITLSFLRHRSAIKIVIQKDSKTPNFLALLVLVVLNFICLVQGLLSVESSMLILVSCLAFMCHIAADIEEESLTVVKNLGYQIDTKYFIGNKFKFIPWQQVQDVFVNEVISKQCVLYKLYLLLQQSESGPTSLVPLFVGTEPRVKCITTIYQCLKAQNQ